MIARIWNGAVKESDSKDYYEYLKKTGVAEMERFTGNKMVNIMQRVENGKIHFQIVSLWDSMEAIRSFAGEDIEKAKYYPEDKKYLLKMKPFVEHYEVTYPGDYNLNINQKLFLRDLM